MIIAFFVLLLGILFAYYAESTSFTESKLEDPIPAKIYDKMEIWLKHWITATS